MRLPQISSASLRLATCAALLACFEVMLTSASLAERLPIRVYTTADGLARDRIVRIVPDSRGYVWFCTTEGVSRFDGYGFVNYGTEQGLPGRIVNDFLEARDGTYWIA